MNTKSEINNKELAALGKLVGSTLLHHEASYHFNSMHPFASADILSMVQHNNQLLILSAENKPIQIISIYERGYYDAYYFLGDLKEVKHKLLKAYVTSKVREAKIGASKVSYETKANGFDFAKDINEIVRYFL